MRCSRVAPTALAADALVGGGHGGVGEGRVDAGRAAAREEHRGAAGPLGFEQRAHALDGGGNARHQRHAVLRIADGVVQHVREFPRAPVAQQHAPGAERAGHDGRQEAGAGDQVEAETFEMRQRGGGGGGALAADHVLRAGAGAVQDDGGVAAGPVQVGFGDLQREGGGGCRVERVAAALQDGHADGGGQPVRAGDHAERAGDLGAGGEHGGLRLASARG